MEIENKKGWHFNPVVDVGNVLTILLMLGALIGIWRSIEKRQLANDMRMTEIRERNIEDRQTIATIVTGLRVFTENQIKVGLTLDGHLRQWEEDHTRIRELEDKSHNSKP